MTAYNDEDENMTAKPQAKQEGWVLVPEDLLTHLGDWETACRIALATAEVKPPDIDDKSYWEHQLVTISKIRAALDAPLSPLFRGIDELREQGWSVAVHNDYHLNGELYTFWLLTHPNGRWIKGEGRTDAEAITAVWQNALTKRDS